MTTFAAILADHAARTPRKVAVVAGDEQCTYAELDARVTRAAGHLTRIGVSRDDVVSSQLANGVDALVVAFAANRIGAVHNPIATIAGARELDFILEQSDARVFIDAPSHALFTSTRTDDSAPLAPPAP